MVNQILLRPLPGTHDDGRVAYVEFRALGARASGIMTLVFRQGALLVGAGLLLAMAGAVALLRVLESRLFGIDPVDVPTYALAALFFGAVAAMACWAPSRTATRVDPMVALRHE